ncbi:MAG TPA: NIPSNAP family protein [Verrucomicrobiota bacterium]|nr:NIPSNAP family protein [Verrucomicrobiota bacterium]
MNRRHFLTVSGSIGLVTATGLDASAQGVGAGRQYLVLQKYSFGTEEQRGGFDAFMKEVALPALNRLGVQPVGVFLDPKEPRPVYVLLPHPDADSALNMNQRLLADAEFARQGAAFIDAPKASAPYAEIESWLMLAFKAMPKVELPAKGPNRVFQLRTYESPSLKTGQKKIEMFNDAGEIRIFRETGLTPVFFGETLFGGKMPNLTYMLGFEGEEQQKAAWSTFVKHPDWRKISSMPEYADARVIRGITNTLLKPAPYSQI